MPQTNFHRQPENTLKARICNRIPNFQFALAFLRFTKGGRIQKLLHALKYKNEPDLGILLGRVYGHKLLEAGYQFDLIIPVPLHRSRLRKRGYNQSSKFAAGLSQSLMIPFSDMVLIRITKTETQTRKTKLKRWTNVSEVFGIRNTEMIARKHILLVDDVVTTGATLEACASLLATHGCGSISIASIAAA